MHVRFRDPVAWTSGLQLVKTALACVIAWALAFHVFGIGQPFLAPWAALLTVHATVFGTFKRGAQQVAATVVGVLVASAAGYLFGLSVVSLGAAVLIGLAAGSVRGLRAEATTAAATAIVVLTAGYSDDPHIVAERLLDTGIGVAVGMLVNVLVWPPLRDRSAAHQIDVIDDRLGQLLCDIAAALHSRGAPLVDEWIASADELDHEIGEAWRVLGEARESGRLNPRPATSVRMRATEDFGGVLRRLEQAIAETHSMARTIGLARIPPSDWDPAFRDPWLELLHRAGAAVMAADGDGLKALRAELDHLAEEMDPGELSHRFWPISGALLVNLRNIVVALDIVAGAQPVQIARASPLGAR
jgi:uncharacterized membrane protein YgaE (UPF0421/DUF939 family)